MGEPGRNNVYRISGFLGGEDCGGRAVVLGFLVVSCCNNGEGAEEEDDREEEAEQRGGLREVIARPDLFRNHL